MKASAKAGRTSERTGSALELLGRMTLAEARGNLEARLTENRADHEARLELGKLLLAGNPPQAARATTLLKEVVAAQPESGEAHLWLARSIGIQMESASLMQAALGLAWNLRKHFELAVRLDPSSIQARGDLFQYCLFAPKLAGGGRERALRQLDRLANLAPNSAPLQQARAFLALRESDFEKAALYFDEAARHRPDFAGHFSFQMGVILCAEERWEEALPHLHRTLQSGTALEAPQQTLSPDFCRNIAFQKARVEMERGIRVTVTGGPRLAHVKRRTSAYHHEARISTLLAQIYKTAQKE